MSTIREQIVEFIAGASLAGAATTGGVLNGLAGIGAVFRSRQAALARTEGEIILVQPKDEKVENRNTGLAIRDLGLEILLFIRSDAPDETADPLLALIHAALFTDQTLGGLVSRIIEEGTEWNFAEADMTGAEVSLTYRIRYLTPTTTLNQLG